MMSLAVVGRLDGALLARLDGGAREVADGAAAAGVHVADDERQAARVVKWNV